MTTKTAPTPTPLDIKVRKAFNDSDPRIIVTWGGSYTLEEAKAYRDHIVRCVNEREGLLALIKKLNGVIEDFMPNIGRCVLQDYQSLNEGLLEAAKVLARAEREST